MSHEDPDDFDDFEEEEILFQPPDEKGSSLLLPSQGGGVDNNSPHRFSTDLDPFGRDASPLNGGDPIPSDHLYGGGGGFPQLSSLASAFSSGGAGFLSPSHDGDINVALGSPSLLSPVIHDTSIVDSVPKASSPILEKSEEGTPSSPASSSSPPILENDDSPTNGDVLPELNEGEDSPSRILYTRDELMAFSELPECKKLPQGLDPFFLRNAPDNFLEFDKRETMMKRSKRGKRPYSPDPFRSFSMRGRGGDDDGGSIVSRTEEFDRVFRAEQRRQAGETSSSPKSKPKSFSFFDDFDGDDKADISFNLDSTPVPAPAEEVFFFFFFLFSFLFFSFLFFSFLPPPPLALLALLSFLFFPTSSHTPL